jgi:hypothetical protein
MYIYIYTVSAWYQYIYILSFNLYTNIYYYKCMKLIYIWILMYNLYIAMKAINIVKRIVPMVSQMVRLVRPTIMPVVIYNCYTISCSFIRYIYQTLSGIFYNHHRRLYIIVLILEPLYHIMNVTLNTMYLTYPPDDIEYNII